MAKSADARDLKSLGSDPISVQIRLLAPSEMRECFKTSLFFVANYHLGHVWDKKRLFLARLCIIMNVLFSQAKNLGHNTIKIVAFARIFPFPMLLFSI